MGAIRPLLWCHLGVALGCLPADCLDSAHTKAACPNAGIWHMARDHPKPQKVHSAKVLTFSGDFLLGVDVNHSRMGDGANRAPMASCKWLSILWLLAALGALLDFPV